MNHHVNNVKSEFTTTLSESIPLDGEWEVSCENLSYRHSIVNLEADTDECELTTEKINDRHLTTVCVAPVCRSSDGDYFYYKDEIQYLNPQCHFPLNAVNLALALNQAAKETSFHATPRHHTPRYQIELKVQKQARLHTFTVPLDSVINGLGHIDDFLTLVSYVVRDVLDNLNLEGERMVLEKTAEGFLRSDSSSMIKNAQLQHYEIDGRFPLENLLGVDEVERHFKAGYPHSHSVSLLSIPNPHYSERVSMPYKVRTANLFTLTYRTMTNGVLNEGSSEISWDFLCSAKTPEDICNGMIPADLRDKVTMTYEGSHFCIVTGEQVHRAQLFWHGPWTASVFRLLGITPNDTDKSLNLSVAPVQFNNEKTFTGSGLEATLTFWHGPRTICDFRTLDITAVDKDEPINLSAAPVRFDSERTFTGSEMDTALTFNENATPKSYKFPRAADLYCLEQRMTPVNTYIEFRHNSQDELVIVPKLTNTLKTGSTGIIYDFVGPFYGRLMKDRRGALAWPEFTLAEDQFNIEKMNPLNVPMKGKNPVHIPLTVTYANIIYDSRVMKKKNNTFFMNLQPDVGAACQAFGKIPAPGCYHEETQLIDAFLSAIEHLRENLHIRYDPATSLFKFSLTKPNCLLELILPGNIAELFGLVINAESCHIMKLENHLSPPDHLVLKETYDNVYSTKRADLKNGVWNIYVYTNLIENHYVGDQMAPILAIFPLQDPVGAYISEQPLQAPSFKVRLRELREIEIKLADYNGERIKFNDGTDPVHLRLHFHRVKSAKFRG